jgi:raffinose/stachyose/melibiose transport system substrate-binding protein
LKKVLCLITSVALCISLLAGCGAKKETSSANQSTQTNENKQVTIKFYHSEDQYNKDMVAAFEKKNPNIKVQIVPIDFGNAEQIIKTGIASGNPVDVSFFWGTQMKTFVSSKMAEDLTPYLEANSSAWKNTFIPQYIDAGKVDGKYYSVSYQPVLETIFYNKDVFKKYNIEVPKTWDDFLKVSEILKQNGVYSMAVSNDQHHQLLAFAYQNMINKGNITDITAGNVPFAGANEAPGLRKCLEMLKDAYQKEYWYPGKGALTSTKDEVNAAFYQGKVAMLFDASSQVKAHSENAKFQVGVMKQPLVSEDSKFGMNVVTNALFIPYNAINKKEAVEFMKFYTSEEGQKITMSSWRPPVLKSVQVEIPQLKEIQALSSGDNVVPYTHLQNLSPKISTYVSKEMVASVCSGMSIDEALKKLESLRQEIKK